MSSAVAAAAAFQRHPIGGGRHARFFHVSSVFLLLALFGVVLITLELPGIPIEALELFCAASVLGFVVALVRQEQRFRHLDKRRKHRKGA